MRGEIWSLDVILGNDWRKETWLQCDIWYCLDTWVHYVIARSTKRRWLSCVGGRRQYDWLELEWAKEGNGFYIVVCQLSHAIQLFWLITTYSLTLKGRYSVVGIATCYGLDDRGVGVQVPVGVRIFTSPNLPDRFWGPHNLLSKGYRELYPRG
jgi:hypothetical protein